MRMFHKNRNRSNTTTSTYSGTRITTNSENNREYAVVTYLFLLIFVALIGYFVYFEAVKGEEYINSPYNKRMDTFEKTIVRGKICGDDGTVLAENVVGADGTDTRTYPYANQYAHVIGYSQNGKAGIEMQMNSYLLRSHAPIVERVANELKDVKSQGDTVVTTLKPSLQAAAYTALGGHDGAVIALDPKTGKVYAMVSKPDFDPNTIATQWDTIRSSEGSILVNRATQGQYPPGSTFKIMTALEYMRENKDYESYSFQCTGSATQDESTITCYDGTVHGTENLDQAFAKSCNSFFATLGLQLNLNSYHSFAEQMLFNKELPVKFTYKKSSFQLKKGASTDDIMQTAIGQGQTLVSPLHMAMIVSTIANDGVLMKPYLVDRVDNYEGVNVKSFEPEKYGALLKKEESKKMQELMAGVVSNGTATALNGLSYTVRGKTGSAEFNDNKGDSHAWFVGYTSKSTESEPDLAIAVIVEGAGTGSAYAVPIARQVFDAYYAQ
ncbi:MAG: peptidoglycan D,D-transpeptidase FtsI family protein [Lachnospiraceae bacterium]